MSENDIKRELRDNVVFSTKIMYVLYMQNFNAVTGRDLRYNSLQDVEVVNGPSHMIDISAVGEPSSLTIGKDGKLLTFNGGSSSKHISVDPLSESVEESSFSIPYVEGAAYDSIQDAYYYVTENDPAHRHGELIVEQNGAMVHYSLSDIYSKYKGHGATDLYNK